MEHFSIFSMKHESQVLTGPQKVIVFSSLGCHTIPMASQTKDFSSLGQMKVYKELIVREKKNLSNQYESLPLLKVRNSQRAAVGLAHYFHTLVWAEVLAVEPSFLPTHAIFLSGPFLCSHQIPLAKTNTALPFRLQVCPLQEPSRTTPFHCDLSLHSWGSRWGQYYP